MPTSVKDRLATTWEPLLLLTRQSRYFFDLDAIRIPARSELTRPSKIGDNTKYRTRPGERPAWSGPLAGSNSGLDAMKARGLTAHPLGKNPGDAWTIPTAAYRGAHFATFPEALVERPLRATCPERTCAACGTPWRRQPTDRALGSLAIKGKLRKSCPCTDRTWEPGVVLDPFMGAGTIGLTAARLGRRWVGIELNPDFAALAVERISGAVDAHGDRPADPEDQAEEEGGQVEVGEAPSAEAPVLLVSDAPDIECEVERKAEPQEGHQLERQAPSRVVPVLNLPARRLSVDPDRDDRGQEQRLDEDNQPPGQVAEPHQAGSPPPRRHIRPQRRMRHKSGEGRPTPRLKQPAQRPDHDRYEKSPPEPVHRRIVPGGSDSGATA
jgi:hypothetical protein